jgi:serine/threonine protein kinase
MNSNQHDSPQVPDHDMLRRVGGGSYGEVWLARNVMGSFRAVKVVYRASFDSDRPFERELSGLQKFEPVSRTHPGLVSILHLGRNTAAGYFYCVMEAADDLAGGQVVAPENYRPRTLAADLAGSGRLPLRECLDLGVALAAALGHLHAHGLVHRDLKPSNIIFVERAPKLADVGLVTQISTKATFVGTEGYLAPEGPGSPGADLYSLGRVLYEINTGKSQDQFPELPTRLRELPEATGLLRLNELVLKACDHRPTRRFRSADEMRSALADLQSAFCAPRQPGTTSGSGRPPGRLKVVILCLPEAAPDIALARLLKERLTNAGFVVVLEELATLSLGWARGLEQQLRGADAIVPILSPAAVRSQLMAYALEVARQDQRRAMGLPFLAPLLSEPSSPLPRHLAIALEGTSPICLSAEGDTDQAVQQTVAALRQTAER